jgi:membrane protein YqaA with SNARE-associated domain
VDPELKKSLWKMLWGTLALMVVFISAAIPFKDELAAIGSTIAGGLGYPGIGIGIMMSDMFTLPIPPDVYLALAVTAGMDPVSVIFWGSLGSMAGGIGAFFIGKLMYRTAFAQRLMAPFKEKGTQFINRLGVFAVIIAAITPLPFSIICVLAGMMGMRFVVFLPATLFRIPRIAGYFLLIKWGWVAAGGGA